MMPVTIQELLWQTSGIRDYIELAAMSGHQLGDSVTTKDLLDMLGRQTTLNFPPGTEYNYSNTNYALLAEIVRRVSGSLICELCEGLDLGTSPHERFADTGDPCERHRQLG